MNRREFTRNSVLSVAGLAASKSLFSRISQINPEIEEIYLIHFTHCDYGFTDHPITNIEQHVEFLKQAMQFCDETAGYPKESRFHWTVEGIWTLENFWKEASMLEKQRFDKLVANGRMEVTAMPANMTMLPSPYEWENELKRLKFFYDTYQPKVVMQNDVNGIPWGMIPSFLEHGFEYVWMGVNEYGSKAPQKVPSLWWWEGPDSGKIKTWLAYHYGSGFDFFHKEWWRRGPVPEAHNIWFNPPSGNETFDNSPVEIDKAGRFTNRKLDALRKGNYPYSKLAISLTNMWRCDNDPPCRQISEFVESWNRLEKKPRLIFSTPSEFFKSMETVSVGKMNTIRGDWSDWWADGLASMPQQIAVLQDAKRRNPEIIESARILNVDTGDMKGKVEQMNHQLAFSMEHTFDAYNSVAYPYNELCMGNQHHRYGIIYEAQERSKNLKAAIIRNYRDFSPFSRTRFIEVMNPGKIARSGWASISGNALRFDVNAAKDLLTGEIFPFEAIKGYDWSEPFEGKNTVLEFPSNVWGEVVAEYRFFLKNLQPGEKRRFELLKTDLKRTGELSELKITQGSLKNPVGNLLIRANDYSIFDDNSNWFPGQIIIEKTSGFKSRSNIENRKRDLLNFTYSTPELVKSELFEGQYSTRKVLTFKTGIAKAIVQEFELPGGLSRLNITTTIWLNEQTDPVAVYMAFPFVRQQELPRYLSYGYPTRVGKDQMPGSCGEYTVVQQGIWFEAEQFNLVLNTPDNPLASFEKLSTRRMQEVFTPANSHVFSMLCNNYWVTNFPILRPAKLVLRHSVEIREAKTNQVFESTNELWAYPVKEHRNG